MQRARFMSDASFASRVVVRGFTLIELLVVIAIIAILASIVLASLNSARVKSRDVRRVGDIKQLQTALELYGTSNGVYPTQTTAANVTTALGATLAPTYISVLPADPTGATPGYQYWGNGRMYVLEANFEGTGPRTATTSTAGGLTCGAANAYCITN